MNIGERIREVFLHSDWNVSHFARELGVDRSTVYRIFRSYTVDTGVLRRVSLLLNHDFFAELSEYCFPKK